MKWYKVLKSIPPRKVGDEIEMEEADAAELVEAGFLEEMKAGDREEGLIAKAVEAFSGQLNDVVATSVQAVVADALKGVQLKTPRIDPGEQEADRTKSAADWLRCVGAAGCVVSDRDAAYAAHERLVKVYGSKNSPDFAERYEKASKEQGTVPHTKTALVEGSGILGGYLTPVQYEQRLLELAAEEMVFANRAMAVGMSTREVKIPALDQTTAPTSGQTSYYGGLQAYWVGESATRTETEPQFKQVTLVANELSGYSVAGRELLADNIVALESVLTRLMGGAIGWYTDFAFMQGNGVGKPLGYINAPAAITTGGASGNATRQTANLVLISDIIAMWQRLLPRSQGSAIWIMHQSVWSQLLALADASSRLAFMPYFANGMGSFQNTPNAMLLGRPIYFSEKPPTLGSTGDVSLVDPGYYLFGNRAGIEIMASEHVNFLKNQMTWRFLVRRDGQPWLDAPFTMSDTTTKVSPFVLLGHL